MCTTIVNFEHIIFMTNSNIDHYRWSIVDGYLKIVQHFNNNIYCLIEIEVYNLPHS